MANDRVSQQHVEALVLPTDQKARTSQQHVEVLIAPIPAARMSQQHVEVLVHRERKQAVIA